MKKITIMALHLYHGGIEKYISNLCYLLENDFDITVISTYKHGNKPVYNFSNKIKIKYLINDYPDRVSLKKVLKDYKFIEAFKELWRRATLLIKKYYLNIKAIKNDDSDIIISTRIFHNNLIGKYSNSKLKIATEHNFDPSNIKYIDKLIKSVKSIDKFIVCTDEMYKFYDSKLPKDKLKIINHCVTIDNNKKSKLNNKNIITVGRLATEKGYEDLIDVMKIIHNKDKSVKLIICGDGYLKESLINKIHELKLEKNIILKGFLKEKELENEYLNSSIYVMSSYHESFGLVLLEAMNYGLPCIAFDSASGAREILNSTGILIKDRDKNKMADEILKLISDKERLNKYQNLSLKRIKDYQPNVIKEEWLKILS